jgi:tetratricopeptide (TPR) repeat protein
MTTKPISFISFDVEALPGRAATDHVNQLIWGKIGGQEFGIKRLCEILKEYEIKGNFLLDLSSCVLYDDRSVEKIGMYLLEQGHELHVHLHSEWLLRKWGLKGKFNGAPGFDQLDTYTNSHFLSYSFFKFRQLFGFDPVVFRGGGYHFNRHTVEAAKNAGFKCLSNFNAQRHAENLVIGKEGAVNEPFMWDNGIIEIPVDFSPEPLSFNIEKYFGWYDRVRFQKKIKTFNLTLHSWSLLRRDGEYFKGFSPEHEERLRYICNHLKENTLIHGYCDYLNKIELPVVSTSIFTSQIIELQNKDILACPICSAIYAIPMQNDTCHGCGSRERHRQVNDAIRKFGNPFTGRRVLANYANSLEKQAFCYGAEKLLNFDIRPVREVDVQMDIQDMNLISSASYESFMAIHVLNHVKDDLAALREIYRVLTPGGIALITIPYRDGEHTTTIENITEHYGSEALTKYGVGSYRRYGLSDAIALFSSLFYVKVVEGYDPLRHTKMNVFFLIKRVLKNMLTQNHDDIVLKLQDSYIGPANLYYREATMAERADNATVAADLYMKARECYNNVAIALDSSQMTACDQSPLNAGNLYYRQATVAERAGEFASAADLFVKAANCFKEVFTGLDAGQIKVRDQGLLNAANLYYRQATAADQVGDSVVAADLYMKARECYRNVSIALDSSQIAACEHGPLNAGNLYYRQATMAERAGEFANAADLFVKAVNCFKEVVMGLDAGQIEVRDQGLLNAANLYYRQATAADQAGDSVVAADLYMKATECYNNVSIALDSSQMAACNHGPLNAGNLYYRQATAVERAGEFASAADLFVKASDCFKKVITGLDADQIKARDQGLLNAANLYYRQATSAEQAGEFAVAADLYLLALQSKKSVDASISA